MARRYKRGQNEIYDQEYNKRLLRSWIVNQEQAQRNIATAGRLCDEQGIRNALLELEGNPSGKLFNPDRGIYQPALIPAIREELEILEERFAHYQQDRLNNGFEKPEKWPSGLAEERYKLEALLDIRLHEAQRLRDMLRPFDEAREKAEAAKVLQYGPQQSCYGTPISEMDGQRVGFIRGVLCIDDERSPYDGLALFEYRKMASKWVNARNEKWMQDIAKAKQHFRETGERIAVRDIGGATVVPREELPEWPEGVKSMKQK